MNIDILIADRAGNKDIFKRSTILLRGKPLIEYTLEASLGNPSIRAVYLSTDDEDLLNGYSNYKGINLIRRPKNADDYEISLKYILTHASENFRSTKPDLVIIFSPGAALVTSKHIEEMIKFVSFLPSFNSVIGVVQEKSSRLRKLALEKNMKIVYSAGGGGVGSEDNGFVFRENQIIWAVCPKHMDKLDEKLISDNSYGFQMNESVSVEVNTPYDLAVAEAMFLYQQERFSLEARGGFNLQRLYIYDDPDMGIRRNVLDKDAYERHFQRYKIFLDKIVSADAILDIACGSGYGSEILASKARSVLGVDADLKTIEYARRHHTRPNITFDVSSAETFTAPGRFDKVISVETIEHLPNPENFLERTKGWLKPGGELWLTCPLSQDRGSKTESPFHISELNKEKLSQIMNRYFKEVKLLELKDSQFFASDTLKNQVVYVVGRGKNI